jgi:L-asparaginase/Glu-tRNA(Gln) amidotransferase subunit D
MKIDLDKLLPLADPTDAEMAEVHGRLQTQQPSFVLDEEYLAMLAFGGTIQSAYVPAEENIVPVTMNPGFDRLSELGSRFGIANRKITGAVLINKDSRDITNIDLALLLRTIQQIPNKEIFVSCGTYMLTIITKALHETFGDEKSNKIIGVTGSWLPASIQTQDVDYNVGGCVAAIKAFTLTGKTGLVFAHFHGEIYPGDKAEKLNLHPVGINPRLARPVILTL